MAKGYSFLGFCSGSFGFRVGPDTAEVLCKKAIEAADVAILYYDKTVGWDPGLRHDFHFAVALAYWDLATLVKPGRGQLEVAKSLFGKCREQLEIAKSFRTDSSMLAEKAMALERTLKGLV